MSYHIVVSLSQTLFHSSFPDHMHIYLFTHLVFLFLISFCPFSLLPQHLQLEGYHGHSIPNFLSCYSLNLDSWPHICFMLDFPSVLVEYTSETHWYPVNPGHLMDPNLEPSPHPTSCPSGWAVLLISCCSIASSFVQVPSSLLDFQKFFLLHSCSSITTCPSTGCTYLLPACHLNMVTFSHQADCSCHRLRSVLGMSHTTV